MTQTNGTLTKEEVCEVLIDQIEPDKKQPRAEFKLSELIKSIKANSLIQPITITPLKDRKYQIVDGERRWRAYDELKKQAKDADEVKKYSTIKAICVKKDSQLLGIIGNIDRNSYNPMETADAYARIKELLGTDKNGVVGKRIGKSRPLVSEFLSLRKLPKEIQDSAKKNSYVPFSKLREIARSKKSASEKIAWYKDLYKEYSSDDTTNTSQTMPNRKVDGIRKRIASIDEDLKKIKFEDVDESLKKDFIKSLETTIDTAQNLLDELKSQQAVKSDES